MDHHYTSYTSQPVSYTTSVYQTGTGGSYHTAGTPTAHYTTTVDNGHHGTTPLSYSITQVRGTHESPLKRSAAGGGDVAYTSHASYTPHEIIHVPLSASHHNLAGSYTNLSASHYAQPQAQSYTVTSTHPQSYTVGAHATTSYSPAPQSYTSTQYVPATNVHGYEQSHHVGGESVKQSRQVQSLPATGQLRQSAPVQQRQSVLSPYRHSMYPEFELVEDLPDRSNLLTSINTLLYKSPARESLLAPPSEVIIKRDSVLSPAQITVQHLLKEKYEDGSIYEGESRNGTKHGRGRLIFKDGRIFEGEFRDGRAQGKGVYYFPNGQVSYQGEIADGVYNGVGSLNCETPTPLQGTFDGQNFGNLGNCWSKYEGEFRSGKKHGQGTLILTDGSKFTGEFKNDRVDGRGVLELRDGRRVQGEWDNGVLRR